MNLASLMYACRTPPLVTSRASQFVSFRPVRGRLWATSAMLEKTRLFRHLEKSAVVVEFGNECSTMEWSFTCQEAMSLSNRPGVTGRQRCGRKSGQKGKRHSGLTPQSSTTKKLADSHAKRTQEVSRNVKPDMLGMHALHMDNQA